MFDADDPAACFEAHPPAPAVLPEPETPTYLLEAKSAGELIEALKPGVSISFLGSFFGMAKEQVHYKMVGAKIVGRTRKGSPTYDAKEAFSRLARPSTEQVMEYVRKMRPNDLPPIMQKEFWDSMLKRQKWERDAGDLFRTDEIEQLLAEVFKNFRMGAMLFADTVARETRLTNEQRQIIVALSDAMLEETRRALLENEAFDKIRNMRELGEETFGSAELPEVDEPDAETVAAANADRKPGRRAKAT